MPQMTMLQAINDAMHVAMERDPDVVRIESATRADNLRTAGPYLDDRAGWNRSQFYGEFNTSKRSLALGLVEGQGAEALDARLGEVGDVVEAEQIGIDPPLGLGLAGRNQTRHGTPENPARGCGTRVYVTESRRRHNRLLQLAADQPRHRPESCPPSVPEVTISDA